MTSRPPFPPFSPETAVQKVRMAEDAWNARDPERVALAHAENSPGDNREFIQGRAAIIQFLTRKWAKELGAVGLCRKSNRRALCRMAR